MANALVPLPGSVVAIAATSARNDADLVASWIASLRSKHSQRNFVITADRFMAALGCTLREATVEDVRRALEEITAGHPASTARQYTQRCKSSSATRIAWATCPSMPVSPSSPVPRCEASPSASLGSSMSATSFEAPAVRVTA